MESRASLLFVVLASLAAGYLLSSPGQNEQALLAEPAYADLVATHQQDGDKLANAALLNGGEVPVETPPPVPLPLPVITPVVSFALLVEPEPLPKPLLMAQRPPDSMLLPLDQAALTEPPPDLDYVATLVEADAGVEEGFDDLEPGTLTRLTWRSGESLYGSAIPTPVLVAEGAVPGPALCLTGAVHGDELNGIEIVRRVMYSLNPEKLTGRVIGVPIVNLQGFERHSRYLPDRRDLNRFFPGNPRGSSASRIAYSFFEQVVRRCDALVDLHTGSFHRTNLPQLRANLLDESVLTLTEGFGGLVILHSTGGTGTLRAAAVDAGIPAVTLEAGEPLRVDDKAVDHSVRSLFTLLDDLGMYDRRSLWGNPEPTYYGSMWVRADKGGMLLGRVKLGKRVREGDVLGTVTDPITNVKQEILAPAAGRVIGMALNQFVMPGYAAFHLGVEAPPMEELPEAPSAEEVDHSVAVSNTNFDERDDSDE